jgi:hypothetical protein
MIKSDNRDSSKNLETLESTEKETSIEDDPAEIKVEKIKSVQRKGKNKDLSKFKDKSNKPFEEPKEAPDMATPNEGREEPEEKTDEIFEVGSTIDLNFDQPKDDNDQLGLFSE